MKKLYIFGMGKGKAYIDRCLMKDKTQVLGIIDNYKADIMSEVEGIPLVRQNKLSDGYDYIIVSLMQYEDTREKLILQGVKPDKIICFFDFSDADNEEYWSVLDSYKWRIELMWKHYRGVAIPTLDNLAYEIYAESETVQSRCPKIADVDRTVEILLKDRKCLARFGDGEFELMCGRRRAAFQDVDEKLGQRLREALSSENENLLIAIANNYGKLDKYTDEDAEAIRSYMSKKVRKEHMKLLDSERQYYDAYLSRPYIIYRNKKNAGKRFDNIRKIWDGQDVLIVEGEYTRFGVGNDLLDNAAVVSRVLAPGKNAFSRYKEIVDEVRKQGRNKLILAVLGPTATVLAYDLAEEGYWVIDIGQLDVEYEWYLRGVDKRCGIPYKNVSEVTQYGEVATDDRNDYISKYKKEVVAHIFE
ncbi:MAG: GT-D fold domain-containing protein [Lachnospiraceae bacterium]|nr:GT-D fold domain-containing protein [Lachnospiraceae bacterium]